MYINCLQCILQAIENWSRGRSGNEASWEYSEIYKDGDVD